MKKFKLEQVKRMLELENKINIINNNFFNLNQLGKDSQNTSVLSNKIRLYSEYIIYLENEKLTLEDWEYFTVASIVPFDEIQNFLKKYDYDKPTAESLKVIADLSKKYYVDELCVNARIEQVKMINDILIENNLVIEKTNKALKLIKK